MMRATTALRGGWPRKAAVACSTSCALCHHSGWRTLRARSGSGMWMVGSGSASVGGGVSRAATRGGAGTASGAGAGGVGNSTTGGGASGSGRTIGSGEVVATAVGEGALSGLCAL